MAQLRVKAKARDPYRKRKRAPPAQKSPRVFKFVQSVGENEGGEHGERTQFREEEGGVFGSIGVEDHYNLGTPTSTQVIKRYETIDEPETPDRRHVEAAMLASSSPLTSLDYEGDRSGNGGKDVEGIFSSDENDKDDDEEDLDFLFDDDEMDEEDAPAEENIVQPFASSLQGSSQRRVDARAYNNIHDDEDNENNGQVGNHKKNTKSLIVILLVKVADATVRRGKRKPCIKAMGRVRTTGKGANARLEWYHRGEERWIPAVYHQDVRAELIHISSCLGQYRYEMAGGKHGELDVTSFHPAFQQNGPEREHWPDILFKYHPHRSDLTHEKPSYWYLHDGRIVIDMNNDAMHDYAEIPATLAYNADPWLLLALMRMNNTITLQDLRGRMPGDQNRCRTDPMGRNRISMNMQRFRKFACCLTWNTIRAVDVQRDYLDKKLPRRCHRENSTRSFRLLYAWEVAELDTIDAGKYLTRTRSKKRDISQAKSRAVYEQKAEIARTMKEAFDRKFPNGAPNDYDTEDEEYRAQHIRVMKAPVAQMTAHTIDDNNDADIKNEMNATPTLTSTRKKRKISDSSMDAKRIYVLPDAESRSPSRSPIPRHRRGNSVSKTKDALCPHPHANYAGFLTTAPNTVDDAQLLYDLLAPTRRHFHRCTGFDPAPTEGDACYNCQHRQIQDELNEWHQGQRCAVEDGVKVCLLVRIWWVDDRESEGTGLGMVWWNLRWNEDWFGEAPGRGLLGREQTDGEFVW